ncbi:dipeptidyl aminopeptidase/acylaminoacyl peptidase [Sphingomonas zeicaulis]|uniref:S9 family peptidase n=1 Tax=Sphingomonas zeicaulis TaxID=1632740 RepID=UPI003D1D3194
MIRKIILSAVLMAATSFTAPPLSAAPAAPLIERAKLFGNPSRAQLRVSPDGKYLSWLAPRDGVMNIWIAPANDVSKAKPYTAEKQRPISQHYWSGDSRMVMYVQDKGGDENFLLYGVDVASGKESLLTPFEKTRVQVVGTSKAIKDKILIGLNNRDARWHDVHLLDLKTGKLTELMRGDGFAGFLADDTLTVRMALRPNEAGGYDFFRVANNKAEDKPFSSTTLEDSLTTQPAGYTADGKTLYWLDSRNRDTAALVAQDVASGTTKIVAENSKADIGGTLTNPRTGVVEAYSVEYLTTDWTAVDPAIGADIAFLKAQLKGDVSITSRTDDDSVWTIYNDPVTGPPTAYLYKRGAKALEKLYVTWPELEGAPLVPMKGVEIGTRDGLTMTGYLSLPPGSDANGDGKPDSPTPLVLLVHGGPWARDSYGYNPYHQWLANRGYAVLSVNYRGSTGFGKKFISAGDLQWGKKMHDDLIDAVDWAVKGGITAKDKVAIMGGSYGGYATLAGLTFTPDTFACGVDIVGPSNLETLLKTIPPYWTAGIQQFYQRMGDPNTPEGLALLKDRSPLYKADKIVKPLLIGQGANDPRVNQAESDQIVAAMRAKNIPVTYVLFPDEGHGFHRPENNIAFNAVAESFLGKCLGGRAEPIGGTVKASTAQVPHGAEFTPGLADALKK